MYLLDRLLRLNQAKESVGCTTSVCVPAVSRGIAVRPKLYIEPPTVYGGFNVHNVYSDGNHVYHIDVIYDINSRLNQVNYCTK